MQKLNKVAAHDIDAVLPQTQCGLCGFNGCMPYAEALAKDEAEINLCPPGGIAGLQALGILLNKDPSPFLAEMRQKQKPTQIAVIREAECIGCTKCIQACPVDAIIGTNKRMHYVIEKDCTGCELCIAPCPVDCIDMIETVDPQFSDKKNYFRTKYLRKQARITSTLKPKQHNKPSNPIDKKSYIEAALQRVKQKIK